MPQPQIYGRFEIAELLDVDSRTPHAWSHRGLLPPPDHVSVNNGPAWDRSTIIRWAVETGRLPESLAEEGSQYGPVRKIRGRMKNHA